MGIARHAKAAAAFATPAAAVPGLVAAVGGYNPAAIPAALVVGAALGALTAAIVWLVPNRTHGFNVNDIADVLIEAGFDAAADASEVSDDR